MEQNILNKFNQETVKTCFLPQANVVQLGFSRVWLVCLGLAISCLQIVDCSIDISCPLISRLPGTSLQIVIHPMLCLELHHQLLQQQKETDVCFNWCQKRNENKLFSAEDGNQVQAKKKPGAINYHLEKHTFKVASSYKEMNKGLTRKLKKQYWEL